MPQKILRGPAHAPLDPLRDATVAVVGYGNQGHAHAQNLKDSGIRVIVGARPGSAGAARARASGFETTSITTAVTEARLVIMALPDEVQGDIYEQQIAPNLQSTATIGFLHGFAIRYGLIQPRPDIGVIMVAPKGPGATLRHRYLEGRGIPCLFALHQDSPAGDAEAIGLAWANGIGCTRAGVIYATIAQETETDLFGEQAVLCGGMSELIVAAFRTLVDAGYPPELAYLECCHEAKQVADLVYERGLAGMMKAISNTAEFGAYEAGPQLIGEGVRAGMRRLLDQIRDGSFAERFIRDGLGGSPWLGEQRSSLANDPIEDAGRIIRELMEPASSVVDRG